MSRILLFNKPFQVLSQFTDGGNRETLAHHIDAPGFYPAGRLDRDSEGLLLLTDSGRTQQRIADPRFKLGKTYWAQVEGEVDEAALQAIRAGLPLKDGMTRPAEVRRIDEPALWPRNPPIRERRHIPTSWIELVLYEGRNRQARRMTAAVGFPTLRLVRVRIGDFRLDGLQPGESRLVTAPD
ncbi:MAG: pseudouridine synthase [Pseudohongiellaceae bacterium]